MNPFHCDESYQNDLQEYTERILKKYGTSSQTAEREILYLAEAGNLVAKNEYAELLFYKKILRKNPYRDAFHLYLEAAGVTIDTLAQAKDSESSWRCSGRSYPLSFWMLGYYLVNYNRESFLKDCETIDAIENLPLSKRLILALQMAVSCVDQIGACGAAINLIGRILNEVSGDAALFDAVKQTLQTEIASHDFTAIGVSIESCDTLSDCAAASEVFFLAAAEEGYVYACNNLAAKEADRILQMQQDGASSEEIASHIETYVNHLKRSADKYEPYAANRLGMFYVEGEVRGSSEVAHFREYINSPLAKSYFQKATVYPDANSAWAFLNLISHFHSDYTRNLELLDEHMGYIEQLNPKVYDIAMEI
ncbi:MAG: hypothetical protein IJ679_10930 [Lachnospiraceae bacterium]|nr:hypothetical protein [Lachnospiraceae bacterium]